MKTMANSEAIALVFQRLVRRTDQFAVRTAVNASAHTIANKVEATYRRGDLFEKRRQLMTHGQGLPCRRLPRARSCRSPLRGVRRERTCHEADNPRPGAHRSGTDCD
jgi:hypothetical protein